MHTIDSLLVLIVFGFIFMHSVSIFATTNADFVRHILAEDKKYEKDFVRDVSASLFNQSTARRGVKVSYFMFLIFYMLHSQAKMDPESNNQFARKYFSVNLSNSGFRDCGENLSLN